MAVIPAKIRDQVQPRNLRIHSPRLCKGFYCCFHRPSKHSMRKWPMFVRLDRYRGLVERTCPHGIGHPDPDSLAFIESTLPPNRRGYEGVHGCDGCCGHEDALED